jgi:hypothetical protein
MSRINYESYYDGLEFGLPYLQKMTLLKVHDCLRMQIQLTAKIAKVLRKNRKELNDMIFTLRTLLQLCRLCGQKDLFSQTQQDVNVYNYWML